MGGPGAETDPPTAVPPDRAKAAHPLALVATGALSLLVFAGGGWWLRGLREGRPAAPAVRQVAADRGADPPGDAHARGRLVFRVHCARCHGGEGRGDGPDAATLRPPPRDLTGRSWRTDPTLDSIRRTVVEGIPGTMMPGLAAALSPRELDAVVAYVQSLAPAAAGRSALTDDLTTTLEKTGFTPFAAGRAAPAFSVRAVGEDPAVTLDRFRGKLVLIVFWGTSCAPCVKELPELERLAGRYRDAGLAVVPVCADESDDAVVRAVAADRAPRLPVYVDPSGTAKLTYDVQSLPTAVLIAPNGDLLARAEGATPWSAPEVDALLRAILPLGPAADPTTGGSPTSEIR